MSEGGSAGGVLMSGPVAAVLASTGATGAAWGVAIAGAAVLVGVLLLRVRQRRRGAVSD